MHGSLKNKIVSADLLDERAKCDFDQAQVTDLFFCGRRHFELFLKWSELVDSDPVLRNDPSWYEMTREEMQECLVRKTRRLYELNRQQFFHEFETGTYQWFHLSVKGVVRLVLTV